MCYMLSPKKRKKTNNKRTACQEIQIVTPKVTFIFPAQSAEPALHNKMTDYANTV